jgi:hypothetical protein
MRIGLLAIALLLGAPPAFAQDYRLQAAAATELRQLCTADAGQLWGRDLCGPLMIVDPSTRQAWATQRDNQGVLNRTTADGGWTGALPQGVPVANASVNWGGVQWIMIVGPLPADATERRVLLMHEAWHRIQEGLGLAPRTSENRHLETERGRYLMRLELRALATAMLSNGRARREAASDALAFRMARHAAFPESAAAEASLDRNEGLASYTGVKLGAALQAALHSARTLDAYDRHQAFARAYAYASGPAYGLLLDEYTPNWRATLNGYAPADLLVGPLRVQALSNRNLQRRAERYGGPRVADEERTRAEARRELVAALRARFTGPRLELPLARMQFEFDPTRVTPVEGLGSVYQTLTLRDVWGEFRATEGALISADFTRLTASSPAVGGLYGPGWTLHLAPGYHMTIPDAEGVVRPQPIPAQPSNGR